MKRVFAVAGLATCLATPAAFAQAKYGSAGCGLGSLIFGPGEGFMQVSASSTNSSYYNQAFGITSGTSNCVPASKAAQIEQQESFVMANYSALTKEAAQGRGETLASFADVLGCEAGVQSEFASVLQSKYDRIFSAPGAMATLDATRRELQSNGTLANACSKLI